MMNPETCGNCGNSIDLNFCPNCGQKKFKRIDGKYIKDEIQYTLLHTNKGFFYTVKKLLQNPGKTTLEYLNGNRVNHYKPILLVFVLSGISTFISYKILNMGDLMATYYNEMLIEKGQNPNQMDFMAKMSNYTTLLIMAFLPFFAISSLIAFRKQGHNYFEHIIINSFLYVLFTLFVMFVISPILFFIKDPNIFLMITMSSFIAAFPLMIWFYKGLYPQLSFGKIIGKSLLMGFLSLILYLVVSIGFGLVAGVFLYYLKH
jgi:hypothetical protein